MSVRDPIIIPQAPPLGLAIRRYGTITPEPSDEEIGKTYLGTPVYSNLIFNADSETPENQDIVMNDVLMSVAQTKNIVTTAVAGRNGTIKEYISDGDYKISVNGIIVSKYMNVFPYDFITALKNLFNLKKELAVSSNFLNVFDISTVVIEEYTFSEQQGSRNVVPFSLSMMSDEPIEIQVNA